MIEQDFEYPLTSTLSALGRLYTLDETPRPAVLVAPDWGGRSSFYCDIAKKLAQLGFVGIALDYYGGAHVAQSRDEKVSLIGPFKKDRASLLERTQQALMVAKEHPFIDSTRLGAIGYCFGGKAVLDLARTCNEVVCVASFHGILDEPDLAQLDTMATKVLILHGYEDSFVPPEQIHTFCAEMTRKSTDWQVHMYGLTHHSFTRYGQDDPEIGLKYSKEADERSWQSLQHFLQRCLQED